MPHTFPILEGRLESDLDAQGRALINVGALNGVPASEIAFVAGATSNLQAQLDALTGGGGAYSAGTGLALTGTVFSFDAASAPSLAGLTLTGLGASRVVATNSSKSLITLSVTGLEVGYLSGVTSSIQTQIGAKLSRSGGTMTGSLILAGDPVNPLDAVTKQYADALGGGGGGGTYTAGAGLVLVSGEFALDEEASPTFEGLELTDLSFDCVVVTNGSGSLVSSLLSTTELEYLIGATGNIQAQIDALVGGGGASYTAGTGLLLTSTVFSIDPAGTPTMASLTLSGLTADRALVSNGSNLLASSATTGTELGYLSGVTSSIQTQLGARLLLAGGTLTGFLTLHAAPTATGHAATKGYVDGLVPATITASLGVTRSANDLRLDTAYSPTFVALTLSGLTASTVLIANGSKLLASSAVTSTELGYLSGATSNIQAQITALAGGGTTYTAGTGLLLTGTVFSFNAASSPSLTALTLSGLTASRALTCDASKVITSSATTSIELGYVSGVTSAIQTQLDSKLALAGGTMTGFLTLSAAPTATGHAATKAYVDGLVPATITASLGVTRSANDLRLDTTYSPTFVGLTLSGLTASTALIANGSKVITSSGVTSTELGYLSGATSNIQAQITALVSGGGGVVGISSAATGTMMWLTSTARVGIGISTPDGPLHIWKATAGTVTANAFADSLTIEHNDHCGLSILTPASKVGVIYFGSPTANNRGQISYNHAVDTMSFSASATGVMNIISTACNPGADNAFDLGGAAIRWKNLYAMSGTFSGGLTIGGGITFTTPGTNYVWIPAWAMETCVTNGTTSANLTPGNNSSRNVQRYSASVNQSCTFQWFLPKDFGSDLQIRFYIVNQASGAGIVRMQAHAQGVGQTAPMGTAFTGPQIADCGTGNTANIMNYGNFTPSLVIDPLGSGGNAGAMIVIQLTRLATDAADTSTVASDLAGVLLQYTRAASLPY